MADLMTAAHDPTVIHQLVGTTNAEMPWLLLQQYGHPLLTVSNNKATIIIASDRQSDIMLCEIDSVGFCVTACREAVW